MFGLPPFRKMMLDHVRMVQWFMLCRHSGVLLVSVMIARTLPVEQVGLFEMMMLCGYLITFFWSEAWLKGYLSRYEKADHTGHPASFIWLYTATGLFIIGLFFVAQSWLLPLMVNRTSLPGLFAFALFQVCILPVWISPFSGLLQGRQIWFLGWYVLLVPSLAGWLGWKYFGDLQGTLTGMVIYAAAGLLWILSKAKLTHGIMIREHVAGVWMVTWPLILYALSTSIARSFDAWLVARYFDIADFAIFRYGAREFPVVTAFAAGLSTIMIPLLRRNEAVAELRSRSVRLMHICYPVVGVMILSSPYLFVWIFGQAYQKSAYIFNIYLLLTLTQLVFPQSIFTARGETRKLWYISLAELGVNIIASLIFLSYFGIAGIAWGTLAAFVFEKIILMIGVRIRYGIHPRELFSPGILAGYAIGLIFCFILSAWMSGI